MEVNVRRAPLFRRERRADIAGQARTRSRKSSGYLLSKRILDATLSFAALIVLMPLFVIIAILIKLDSRGPVFYRRRVVAQNGHSPHPIDPTTVVTFDAFKFRSMCPDADSVLENDPVLLARYLEDFKLDDDPRITRFGQALRKTNLDELPQLVNVLLGQMSLVGPRIITPPELAKYGSRSKRLVTARPGMSGFWQVLRGSNHSYCRRVKMDMAYVRRRNTWLDLKIIAQTIGLVLGVRNSG